MESKGMKSLRKSFGVFDFKEEDGLTEMTVEKIPPEFGCPQALNAENITPELGPVLQNDFVTFGQATEIKEVDSGIIFSNVEYGSSPGATMQVKSVCLAADAINSRNERLPSDISNNNASSHGPSSDNCFGGGDLTLNCKNQVRC